MEGGEGSGVDFGGWWWDWGYHVHKNCSWHGCGGTLFWSKISRDVGSIKLLNSKKGSTCSIDLYVAVCHAERHFPKVTTSNSSIVGLHSLSRYFWML